MERRPGKKHKRPGILSHVEGQRPCRIRWRDPVSAAMDFDGATMATVRKMRTPTGGSPASAREPLTRFNWQAGFVVSVKTRSYGTVVVGWRDNGPARGVGGREWRWANAKRIRPKVTSGVFFYLFLFLFPIEFTFEFEFEFPISNKMHNQNPA
jgi:hypothetical protein